GGRRALWRKNWVRQSTARRRVIASFTKRASVSRRPGSCCTGAGGRDALGHTLDERQLARGAPRPVRVERENLRARRAHRARRDLCIRAEHDPVIGGDRNDQHHRRRTERIAKSGASWYTARRRLGKPWPDAHRATSLIMPTSEPSRAAASSAAPTADAHTHASEPRGATRGTGGTHPP